MKNTPLGVVRDDPAEQAKRRGFPCLLPGNLADEGGVGGGQFPAEVRVKRAESVALAGPLGQAKERGQREHQVRQPGRGRRF